MVAQPLLPVETRSHSLSESYLQFPAQLIQAFHCFEFPARYVLQVQVMVVEGFPWTGSSGAQALAFAPSAFPDQKTSASTLKLPLVRSVCFFTPAFETA